ncbi:TlpA family protein disulfide reductase [Pedobacter nyackensis]|uniref:TlpA family protein disulfide reductase n=1 Tax=Pedobacter nyackensis TaxID=475255 RepID=UPI00292FE077|nr:thioredoxin-like domain-containing protein [Pedobacter nyackensis]
MKFIITISLIILVLLDAKSKNNSLDTNKVMIKGVVSDTIFNLTPDKEIVVHLWVSAFPSKINVAPTEYYSVQVKNNEPFTFKFSAPSDRFYVHIGFTPNSFHYWSFSDNTYIMDRGDKISCRLSTLDFSFSGIGAEKFNCQSKIYHCLYLFTAADAQLVREGRYQELFENQAIVKDSLLKAALKVVDEFSIKLGKELTETMIANCFGTVYYNGLKGERSHAQDKERINAVLNSRSFNLDMKQVDTLNAGSLIASPIYLDYLFEKIVIKSIQPMNDEKIDRIKYVYRSVRNDFSGIIREKMLTLFFLNYGKRNNILEYAEDALTLIRVPSYRDIVNDVITSSKSGDPFFPFELEDEKGNMVKLNDLNDKVIVLDLWFTGCVNCTYLSKAMKPVFEKFKDNSNVVFISVCTDKTKQQWLESLSKGEYTHPQSLNLFAGLGQTENKGTGNQLIKRYNITSFPTVFIIKNGKMFNPKPPDARRDKGAGMIKNIDEALTATRVL